MFTKALLIRPALASKAVLENAQLVVKQPEAKSYLFVLPL